LKDLVEPLAEAPPLPSLRAADSTKTLPSLSEKFAMSLQSEENARGEESPYYAMSHKRKLSFTPKSYRANFSSWKSTSHLFDYSNQSIEETARSENGFFKPASSYAEDDASYDSLRRFRPLPIARAKSFAAAGPLQSYASLFADDDRIDKARFVFIGLTGIILIAPIL